MKEQPVNRVVGRFPQDESGERKNALEKTARDTYEFQFRKEFLDTEREKTPEELHIINIVDTTTNKILREYGVPEFHMPAKAVHVIKADRWKEYYGGEDDLGGSYDAILQGIIIPEVPIRMLFAHRLAHETTHLKGYNALRIVPNKVPPVESYRSGISVKNKKGERMLHTLNEAIVEELAMRCSQTVHKDSIFDEERKSTDNIKKYNKDVPTPSGELLFANKEIYHARVIPPKGAFSRSRVRNASGVMVSGAIATRRASRIKERGILNELMRKTRHARPTEFKDREAIFRVFARATLQGTMLPLRIIDEVFGKGTLRHLADLEGKIDELEKYAKDLKPITSSPQ